MPDLYAGLPATVIANLPTAKNISSTSNTSPIVVTTSTTHNIQTGDYVYVTGAADTNANGIFTAGTVTSTTVVLAGTTTGGGGGAAGTILDLGFGPRVPVPTGNDPYKAATFAPGYVGFADRTAWLIYAIRYAMQLKAGGSSVMQSGHSIGGTWDYSGVDELRVGRVAYRPRVTLPDSDQTINVNQGDTFVLPSAPGATRTITLTQTGADAPKELERIRLLCLGPLPASGFWFHIRREGGGAIKIATIEASTQNPATLYSIECEFSGGAWRLGMNSGYFDVDGANKGGILPGAHA